MQKTNLHLVAVNPRKAHITTPVARSHQLEAMFLKKTAYNEKPKYHNTNVVRTNTVCACLLSWTLLFKQHVSKTF